MSDDNNHCACRWIVIAVIGMMLVNGAVLVGLVYAQGGRPMGPPRSDGDRRGSFQRGSNNAAGTSATNQVRIVERNGYRYITSNGIADHETGSFPNRGNPNAISAQNYSFRVTLKPKKARRATQVGQVMFGVALNGVPFDPGTAELWNNNRSWRYDALSGKINLGLDENNAHVQPNGAYHYHGLPIGLIHNVSSGKGMVLVGYAADGFPVYALYAHERAGDASSKVVKQTSSYQLKKGRRPSGSNSPGGTYDGTFDQDWEYVAGTGTLDESNGREGVTPEYPDGTYYYVLTDTYPFIPRLLQGTADSSFRRGRTAASSVGGRQRSSSGHPSRPSHGHDHPHHHPPR